MTRFMILLIGVLLIPTGAMGAEDGETPLHLAAGKGDVEEVKRLLSVGADVEARDEDRGTALHEGIRYNPRPC